MPTLTRDQERAQHAYACVDQAKTEIKEYKIAVNTLAAVTKRSGMAAAFAFLERQKGRKAVNDLQQHMGAAKIPGLSPPTEKTPLTQQASALHLPDYMLATRELLKVLIWFRRAVQATPDQE